MERLRPLLAGLAAALILLAAACANEAVTGDVRSDGIDPGGLVHPNTFLSYDGQRYQLVQVLVAEELDEAEFHMVGVTRNADVAFERELPLFERAGDREALYTFAPESEDDVAYWLRWQRRG